MCHRVDKVRACISIHALLAESDFCFSVFDFLNLSFLSTLSLRRATRTGLTCGDGQNISIHALLAESDVFLLRKITITVDISIHALLAESDLMLDT